MKIEVDHGRCISCAGCVGVCPVDALSLVGEHLTVDQSPCISCDLCVRFCPVGALAPGEDHGAAAGARPERVVVV
ncbi:MAG: DUF362 domain-containing protein [Thermoplasmatota archaeon]